MASTAYLMAPEELAAALGRESRSERMEQRVKPSMKRVIELAAALAGTDTSEFVSIAAFQAAMDRIGSTRRVRLASEDAIRFFAALDRNPPPNAEMRKLMTEHDQSAFEDGV